MPAKHESDFGAPQREAAMFCGLFLRGHPPERLRQDIDIPKALLEKWLASPVFESSFRDSLRRVYRYRKQVLAIFDALVGSERAQHRWRLQ